LKDLITYIKELQSANESKAKVAEKVSKTINNLSIPLGFRQEGGIGEANEIFKQHHKQSIAEAVKAREVYNEVISQLASLRSDLSQKIKEIKSLSGDFKNNIEKEKENTKKIVGTLQESLAAVDTEVKAMVGKDDPYIVRLAVDRQVERQIDEENYLHRVTFMTSHAVSTKLTEDCRLI
jgi:sugar-specific transcriptional regulator TrmB